MIFRSLGPRRVGTGLRTLMSMLWMRLIPACKRLGRRVRPECRSWCCIPRSCFNNLEIWSSLKYRYTGVSLEHKPIIGIINNATPRWPEEEELDVTSKAVLEALLMMKMNRKFPQWRQVSPVLSRSLLSPVCSWDVWGYCRKKPEC